MSQSRRFVWTTLVAVALFEALLVVSTQLKGVRAGSPWQDDPYDTVVSFAVFALPALGFLSFLRLLVRSDERASEVPVAQLVRASWVLLAIAGGTAGVAWTGVVLRADRALWTSATAYLGAGLGATSVLLAGTALLGHRLGWPRRDTLAQDWLGDGLLLVRRLPLVGGYADAHTLEWVRRHVVLLFVLASALAATGVIGALGIGEGWTDPWLYAWALSVEFTSNLALCLVLNATLGLIRRGSRSAGQSRAETAFVAGCLSVQAAVAFRSQLAALCAISRPDTVVASASLTLGSGLVVALGYALGLWLWSWRGRNSGPRAT